MRISRPCYDKFHRCPGWAGAGWKYPKESTCDGGSLAAFCYEGRWWKWRFNQCQTCGIWVLPYLAHWLDPRWWTFVPTLIRRWVEWQWWKWVQAPRWRRQRAERDRENGNS